MKRLPLGLADLCSNTKVVLIVGVGATSGVGEGVMTEIAGEKCL